MIGKRLGSYEILRKLGSGGMGDVYAARDAKLGREVALKVLPPAFAQSEERRKRFEREARAAAALNHPGIVILYSVEEADGECFLTMEIVEGSPLSEVIPSEGLGVHRLLDIAIPLVDAVASAHEQGITHRDLKPQNVILTPDGVPKVLDFGLARFEESRSDVTSTAMPTASLTTGEGRVLGTPAYMSPEQAEGKPVDHRTDIFSLGVMLYEMACGQRPFVGDSAMSTISSVLKDTPQSLVELRASVPSRLACIVKRSLAKDRRRRYQSARDLASDLEELRDELRSASSISGVAVAPARVDMPPRVRMALLLAAGFAVAAATGVAGYFGGSGRANRQPAAENVREAAPAAPAFTRFRRLTTEYGAEIGPQLAPDGKWIVYAAGRFGSLDVFRQRVGGAKRTNLTEDNPKDDWQPSISPDGERIAFRSERGGGGIYVMGATGESARRVTDFGFHPAWSPDGKSLVVNTEAVTNPRSRSGKSDAWRIDVESGRKELMPGGQDALQGTWSPSSRRIAFWGTFGTASTRSLFTVPREGGEPTLLVESVGGSTQWTPHWSADGRFVYYATTASGVMNIWRAPLDESTGSPTGRPEQVTAGVAVSADYPSLSRDGTRMAFSAAAIAGNIAKIPFDAKRGRVEGPPVMLTRGSNGYSAPDASPDGERVVFCSSWVRQDTHENIYLSRSDGSDLRALTADEGKKNRLPRWTADGKEILFYSNRSGDWETWSVAPDGSGLRQVTKTPGEATLFSIPARRGSQVIAWVQLKGMLLFPYDQPFSPSSSTRIPHIGKSGYEFLPSDWSPDGKRVVGSVAASDVTVDGIYSYSVDAKQYERIADHGGTPRWLADGKRLVSVDEARGVLELIDVEKKRTETLLSLAPDSINGHIGVSPDERWIYISRIVEDGDVWLADRE